jgi:hypothetical protein
MLSGVYLDPPEGAVVLSIEEKTQGPGPGLDPAAAADQFRQD